MSRIMHLFRITVPYPTRDMWFDVKAMNMRTAINANFDCPNEIAIVQFQNVYGLFRVKIECGSIEKARPYLIGWIEHIGVVE